MSAEPTPHEARSKKNRAAIETGVMQALHLVQTGSRNSIRAAGVLALTAATHALLEIADELAEARRRVGGDA